MAKTIIRYDQWNKGEEMLRESLCTLGNGIFCTRGAAEEHRKEEFHYPGTYLAGGYNRAKSEVQGHVVENEDLVNWPNWLFMSFRTESGQWLDLDQLEIEQFEQNLHVSDGFLERRLLVTDREGRTTEIVAKRLVHLSYPHYAAILWELTPKNWSGKLCLRSGIDGSVQNLGVKRYQNLTSKHIAVVEKGRVDRDTIYLVAESLQSHIRMAQACRCTITDHEGKQVKTEALLDDLDEEIYLNFSLNIEQGKPLRIEKLVSIFSSKDLAISEAKADAIAAIGNAMPFDQLLDLQKQAWSQIWKRCDIMLVNGLKYQQDILRLHIFHLLQTVSINSIDHDIGVPARGWHGEAYRGHVFWDEIFIFPLLNLTIPELTRELLMYRFRRLPAAIEAAKREGYRGAMFPWQSGSNGREESQMLHLNPMSGQWHPDHTYKQRHINGAIAYNIWQYFQATDDIEFMSFYGIKMLLEIARLWSSIAEFDESKNRYVINNIAGPDEFHTAYPDSQQTGLNNNAYTNILASWTLRKAQQAFGLLAEDQQKELRLELDLSDEEFRDWADISRRLFIPFLDGGIISQFEGYKLLEEFDWEYYQEKYQNIQRLDRILKAEGKDPNRYKIAKQADVLMLFYLFSSEELQDIFEHLSYPFEPDTIPKTVHYYIERTSHGSTLSRIVHGWVLARSDRKRSWKLFCHALESDLKDVQGGTTREGIHLGAMAGTVDMIQRCYTGIVMRDDILWFNPSLPDGLKYMQFPIRYRGHWLKLSFEKNCFTVHFEKAWSGSARVGYCEDIRELKQGESTKFEIRPTPCQP